MRYSVKTLGTGNQVVSFTVDAADRHAAQEQAKSQGYTVLAVKPARMHFTWPRNTSFPTLLFSQELMALLSAGLSLVEAIETIVEKESREEIRKIVDGILQRLYQGQSFSAALEACPQQFQPLYVATVRASEKTGDLPQALERYVAYHEQANRVRSKIESPRVLRRLQYLRRWSHAIYTNNKTRPLRPLRPRATPSPTRPLRPTGGHSYQQIADYFGVHFTTVGRIVRGGG